MQASHKKQIKMKFHEINSKFRFHFSDATEVLTAIEFKGETARCSECRFKKVASRSFSGRPDYSCRLEYKNTQCGIPNNKWSNENERIDNKQIIYK